MKPLNRLAALNRPNAFLTRLTLMISVALVLLRFPAVVAAESSATAGQSVAYPKSVHRIVWDRTLIPVTLVVGVERRVGFEDAVRVGVPVAIQSVLRTQSTGGGVYWLADQPFDVQRVQVQQIKTGEIILIDLKAVKKRTKGPAAPSVPIEVVTAQDNANPDVGAVAPEKTRASGLDYVTLTRYAAQQLYAPQRLLRPPEGVYQAPVPRGSVALVRGQPVEAIPVAAWRGGHLYVTAVRLRNLAAKPVILDPRTLRGRWLAATFQHARLHPTGDEADTTTVYLISARPFEGSL